MANASYCAPLLDLGPSHTPQVDRLRRAAFGALRTGAAPRLTHLAATIEGDLVADPTVTGAEGVTVETTPNQLDVDGRHLHTWCAFDTVGIPAALRVDAEAHTTCPTCGTVIHLDLPGGFPPPSPVVGWWPEVTGGPLNESFCPTAHLFCNRAHLDTWRTNSARRGEPLSLSELADRGRTNWSLFNDCGDHS